MASSDHPHQRSRCAQPPSRRPSGAETSGLNCLDNVVKDVWREGYSHHITRLMILSNLATLLDVSPRELTDWFWVAYVDAYDWVVEPNVLGMSTFSLGPLFTTKPYVSGSGYIHRMSDYCKGCRYDPNTTCPFRGLYWAFLLAMPMCSRRIRASPRSTGLLPGGPPNSCVRINGNFDAVKRALRM